MFRHTIRQMENLQEHFDVYKEEKERVFKVLKMENEQFEFITWKKAKNVK